MTNEQIFELAEKHGDWDDFGRWTFRDDGRLLAFVDALLKAERETCAVLIENTPTMLGSPKRDNLSWVGQPDLARVGEVGGWGDKREWVGLTDEERLEVASRKWWHWEDAFDIGGFARAIEQALKEKNT